MFKVMSHFNKLLDKACSLANLDPDWTSIMQICDCIRQRDVHPKFALNAIKKKLYATNPNVVLLALQVLESCVKNCGTPFHVEVTSKAFMDELREMAKVSSDSKVREEVLKLIQLWAHAFRNDSTHRAVQDTLNIMKNDGYMFPALKESDAMFAADCAPDWADGDCCYRCRTRFSMVQRKYHCRNCGQIFCAKCSAKQSIIPKYRIEKEVRVCDDCYDKLNKAEESALKNHQTSVLTQRVINGFNNQELSDFVFKIDSKYIYVYKSQLILRCDHFRRMFSKNNWNESDKNEKEINDYSYDVYYAFLKYLYTDTVDIDSKHLIGLIDLANCYLEEELKQRCVKLLKNQVTIDNYCDIYACAVKYNLQELREYCSDFLDRNLNKSFARKLLDKYAELKNAKLF